MTLSAQIKNDVESALKALFPYAEISSSMISVNLTKPEFTGDYTVVLFPFVKLLKMKPDALGAQLGDYLVANTTTFRAYSIVSGFLNLSIKDIYWTAFLATNFNNSHYGEKTTTGKNVMVEYSSPNTNKPLHFGHLRNIFLGAALSEILEAAGDHVIKANLINDRGIHICKSMIAWQHHANGATPESAHMKGDHLVGHYYVVFNDDLNKEVKPVLEQVITKKAIPPTYPADDQAKITKLLAEIDNVAPSKESEDKIKDIKGKIKDIVVNNTSLMKEAAEMLRKWEAGDADVRHLWETMNGWVYKGFDATYKRMGITFDKVYHESETYLLGKQIVEEGLKKGVLFTKENGSIWIDLKDDCLDEKLLLRGDGTSVYITQDLGTAKLKHSEFNLDKSLYVIADEQNYHMQVLALILKKLGEPCADGIIHMSYGMVELPSGRMKSREGTVVDADDMIDEMVNLSKEQTEQAGKTEGFTADELTELYNTIGLGALKFYLLRVEPKKKMIFDPKESIDLHGFTAAFIQYAHARICSILRKENVPLMPAADLFKNFAAEIELEPLEKKLILHLEQYANVLAAAATEYNPSELCNYSFQLAQSFNSFYDVHSISKAESEEKKQLRIMIVVMAASVLRHAMGLLGIRLPEKM